MSEPDDGEQSQQAPPERAPTGRKIRMVDVARAAGVSPMTVSRSLRQDSSVAPQTREKVLQVIEQLGYVPDQIAGGLSSKRSGFVAALVPSFDNPHFADSMAALIDTVADSGLQVLVGYTEYNRVREETLLASLLSRRPEAIVLTFDGHSQRSERLLASANVPIIQIWEIPKSPIQHVVGFSNFDAFRTLTTDLINAGYRRLVFLGELADEHTRGYERRRGFVAAMSAAGLDHTRQFAACELPISAHAAARALPELTTQFPDVDGVVCVSDPAAFGVLTECKRRRIEIPDELGIAGFGDFDVSGLTVPTISTVTVDANAIGRTAGTLINEILTNGEAETLTQARIIRIATATVLRDSTRQLTS
ncbi:MAG: LacI family DNA-binding transcriptional regulator [Pseudomonadota bacterium]